MEEEMLKIGPQIVEGSIWDDGGKTEIVQILISYDLNSIRSIEFVYFLDGIVVHSETHGEVNLKNFAAVGFDYPSEYLVSVSGQQDYDNGLSSITFKTNKREYGPFGSPAKPMWWNEFSYYFRPKSSFGGFHGSVIQRSNSIVLIGVYIRPVQSLDEVDHD